MDLSLKQKRVYSEVYSFLKILGKSYTNKVPIEILDIIKSEKDDSYTKKIDPDISIENQGLLDESISMILWLNLEYFSNSEERDLLEKIYDNNQNIYEQNQREKYNINNIFYKKEKDNKLIVSDTKKSIIRIIIEKIKDFLKR